MFNKRGEMDKKFLIFLVLVVAVIFLSNNGLFSGRATKTVSFEAVQAEGSDGSLVTDSASSHCRCWLTPKAYPFHKVVGLRDYCWSLGSTCGGFCAVTLKGNDGHTDEVNVPCVGAG